MGALIEPFFYCLLASMIWAPLIFLGASFVAKNEDDSTSALSGKVWPAALMLAALPVLMAPIAAALGLSLRAPAPLPPMPEPAVVAAMETAVAIPDYVAASTVTLADVLRASAVMYFYGFLMLFMLAAIRHVWFSYRLNFAAPLDEPQLERALEAWRIRIGVSKKPRYVFSHIVSSVCVYGFIRPVVVMPFNLLDRVSIEDAALMGAHEMAHIRRGDVALFALCSVAKAVFWFNPFMHQICARANLAAEQGADALVLARGVDRRQYAHCFVQGLRLAANARYGSFAGELIPSFTPFDKRSRRQRLDAILSGVADKPALSLSAKIGLSAGAGAAAALAFAQAAFAVAPPSIQDALPVTPVEGEVTLAFGDKDKLLGKNRVSHEGIDIRAARGAAVRASGAGKVIDATDHYRGADAWGKVVVIDHGHGLVTRYAHLDSYKVHKGDQVAAGDIIGAVGSTGVASGPHLHFEVISEGKTIDPAPVAAPAPAAAPLKKTSTSTRRSVQVAAAPVALAALPAPQSQAAPEDVEAHLKEKKAHKLKIKKQRLEERMRTMFEEFDAFKDLEGKSIRFNDLDLNGFEGAQQFAEMFDGKEFDLKDFSEFNFKTPDMSRFFASVDLSEEELEAIREEREVALEAAADAIESARESIEESRQARIEAQAEAQAAIAEARAEMKERQRERKEAEREHQRAMREAERERARAEREWQDEYESMVNEEEMLAMREEAAREAKRDLERELAEIEQRRKELKKSASRSN
ncbi:M23/M56 family metallopeptidase [Hyphococcus sp.]|uniref:M23/M56 family metallopeptidase n=1 Tax=Hyphococcus sp. TaxID=2038636 RepID=UPI0020825CD3|nr:MAG: hypothetical protein DHS20C04_21650 [Marinicaulis sp.]